MPGDIGLAGEKSLHRAVGMSEDVVGLFSVDVGLDAVSQLGC